MTTVVGVRFREVGKIYYFDPGTLDIKEGDNVIVDTARGTEFGTVIIGRREVEDDEIVKPLKVVRRIANADDVERVRINRNKEADAFRICKEKIKERELDMKLISAEYTFDNAKILFYFTADGRIDFRELVKDLAAIFKIRIELRQVGVRDETKLMGGLGSCGRELCCCTYLSDFVPVSIRMAKEQNLSLNPQKISGMCGRLMCCLKNEADTYEDLNTRLPKQNGEVTTPDGRKGVAADINVLRERVKVVFTDEAGNREMEEYPASELKFNPRRKAKPQREVNEDNDDIDDIEDEIINDEENEENPELVALEEAELDDIEADENKEDEENLVRPKSDAAKRRRRRRRRRPNNGNGENAQSDANAEVKTENAQPAGQTDGENKPKKHRFRYRRRNNKPKGDGAPVQNGEN